MPVLNHASGQSDPAALEAALDALPDTAQVILMIHGFKFRPRDPVHCPFAHILSLAPDPRLRRIVSWPRHLGAGRDAANAPLCIAFGWPARGSIWNAWAAAGAAAADLADLLAAIDRRRRVPTQIIAHSLGARVALGAVEAAPAHSVGRLVLLAGAVFRSQARAALDSPAGQEAEVVNVISRENDLFDVLLETSMFSSERTVGTGLGQSHRRWLDLQIDNDATRLALRAFGHPVARPDRWICHWSAYVRPGLFPLYRRLLGVTRPLPLAVLRAALPAVATARWSQFLPHLPALPVRTWPQRPA